MSTVDISCLFDQVHPGLIPDPHVMRRLWLNETEECAGDVHVPDLLHMATNSKPIKILLYPFIK